MALQKNFPSKRHYYFWAILANHLADISADASEIDRRLCGPLAFKMIAKAASEVPDDAVSQRTSSDLAFPLMLLSRMSSSVHQERSRRLKNCFYSLPCIDRKDA